MAKPAHQFMPVVFAYFQFVDLMQRFAEQDLRVLYHAYEPDVDDETLVHLHEIGTEVEYDV